MVTPPAHKKVTVVHKPAHTVAKKTVITRKPATFPGRATKKK